MREFQVNSMTITGSLSGTRSDVCGAVRGLSINAASPFGARGEPCGTLRRAGKSLERSCPRVVDVSLRTNGPK